MICGVKRLWLFAVIVALGMGGGVAEAADGVPGVDVSNWTGDIDWESVASGGGKFAFVHATEGTNYRNPRFDAQFGGAAAAGLVRGAYHFAQPHESDGATQAEYFLQNGGSWIADGQTLQGVLDIEDNPYKDKNGKNHCYDLSTEDMVTWLKDFTTRYRARTGRHAIIYTTTSWWQTCTGNSTKFKSNPLWLARWGSDPGELPKSWKRHTFWQSADKGPLVGGANAFNGSEAQLKAMANPPAEVSVTGAAKSRRSYTITVANTGPHPVTNVKVSGRAFGGQRVVKAPGCSYSGTAVRCTIADLPRGKKVTFTFTTKPRKSKGTVGLNITVGSVKLSLKAG
ncbi:putative repeat protein (TIGR01451 family) [Nonomuraea polychroma]|uniref:lysozyme n=1 Tax=Nonomuraea polychroma TaxID=46176 RepID=A0A438MME2_9ACTN|nr:putative repeat protein (TIGR01451 family) [Nonomuraea polychroma]